MKRFLSWILCICMMLSILPVTASAATTVDSGTCGTNVNWSLDSDGVLTISGTGPMDAIDYSMDDGEYWPEGPWSYSAVKSVVIEDGVTSIGAYAFLYHINLKTVSIANSVTSIGSSAFRECKALTSINIPSSVTSIGNNAFYKAQLTSFTIPVGVSSVDGMNFDDIIGLKEIIAPSNHPNFTTEDGVLFNKDKTQLIAYPREKEGSTYVIPETVTSLATYAFSYTNISTVTIPSTITKIPNYAFYYSDLTEVTIPEGVTEIGDRAFDHSYSLATVILPKSLTKIGGCAFDYCPALHRGTVIYAGSETDWAKVTIGTNNNYISQNVTFTAPTVGEYGASISTTTHSVTEGDTISISVNVDSNGLYTNFNAAELGIEYSSNLTFNSAASTLSGATATASNGVVTIVDKGETEELGNGVYTLSFTANSAGSATVTLNSAAFGTAEEAESQDLVAAACNTTPVTITINEPYHNVTLSNIFAGNSTVQNGSDYTFSKEASTSAYYDYAAPTATVGGASATVIDNGDGTWTVKNVTGTLVISGTRTAKQYDVTITGDTASNDGAKATYNTDYTFTLPEDVAAGLKEGYTYALTSVSINNSAYTGYSVDGKTYTIPGKDIVGNIAITITKTTQEPNQFTVSVSGDGAGAAVGKFPATVAEGSDFTLTLNPEAGYEYTVTTEGYDVTANGNKYTISNITGNVTFMISRSVSIAEVTTTEYVTLNGTMMWLVKNETAKLDGKVYTYGGQAMYWSDRENAYCILVVAEEKPTPTAADFTIAAGITETLAYGNDVNMTGTVDANDAQLVYNIYMSGYAGFTENVTMKKFLLADVNGDGIVDVKDAAAIVSFLLA